jgi:hypothetical protein
MVKAGGQYFLEVWGNDFLQGYGRLTYGKSVKGYVK